MAKTIKIDGTDYTDFFTRVGYSVTYQSIQGKNGGLMLDGSYTEDELALKAVVALPCKALNEEKLSALLTKVYSAVYHQIYYFDPKTNSYRTMEARRAVSQQNYRGFSTNGYEFWTDAVVTFTER